LLPRSGLERSDFVPWHFSDAPGRPYDVRSQGKTGSGLSTPKMTRLTHLAHGPNWLVDGIARPATSFISSKTMMQWVGFKFD
jgi:hypothetical protein